MNRTTVAALIAVAVLVGTAATAVASTALISTSIGNITGNTSFGAWGAPPTCNPACTFASANQSGPFAYLHQANSVYYERCGSTPFSLSASASGTSFNTTATNAVGTGISLDCTAEEPKTWINPGSHWVQPDQFAPWEGQGHNH